MLGVVLFVAAVMALFVVLLLAVVVAGIRQEPTDARMTSRAPRPTAALARLLLGAHVAARSVRRRRRRSMLLPGRPQRGRTAPVNPGNTTPGRQLLSVMPLHAVTTMHGEQGLRERLALETARLTDPCDRRQVSRALQLAARLHAGDRRQREPYVNHLLRVALRVMVHYGVWEPDVICAALLHDAVEDHADEVSTTGRPGALTELAAVYGARVAELVAAVTNPVYAPGSDKDQQYREHVVDSLAACPWARIIKLSDFTDNGVGVIHTTGDKAVRPAHKYAPLVPALAELAARPDTPLSHDVKVRILAQLGSATDRFDAIIAASAEGR